MEETQMYYLKEYQLSPTHKQHISEGITRMYARHGGKRTELERQHISEGMKRHWDRVKRYWADHGFEEG